MSNTLQTTSTTARNPFLAYAESMTRNTVKGDLLKFTKGDYLAGKHAILVPIRTELVAIMSGLTIGWIKWRDNKPTGDYRMGLVVDNYVPPRRSELDDEEGDNWETDKSGDLKDPWQFTNMLPMIDLATKAIYTFSASSRGGLDAIGKLCKEHAKKTPAGRYPVIRLEVGSYQHPDKSIGRVKFPIFEVVKFVKAEGCDSMLAESRGEGEALTAPRDAPAAIEHDAPISVEGEVGERPFAPVDAIDDDSSIPF